ncbi:MAG: hypothetical protein AAFU60_15340, partial [Bacteroidota bacterium]
MTTNDPDKQQQAKSGGLTLDVTDAENFTTILAIAPSPHNQSIIWVGTDDGNLQLTRDGGKNWTNLSNRLPGMPAGSWIPQIVLSPHTAGEAFIVVNDYRRNNYTPMAFHTKDFGATFTRIVDRNQVHGHVISIVQDPVSPNLLFLGTDYGLYWSINKGKNWMKWMEGFPSVSTSDLKIHPRDPDLIIGTFGRAAWIMDDIQPLRDLAEQGKGMLNQPFKAFDAPDAYMAQYRSVEGMRFHADATFSARNKPRGALLTVWVKSSGKEDKKEPKADKPAESKKKKGQKAETPSANSEEKAKTPKGPANKKLKVEVLDQQDKVIRTFHRKIEKDTGLVRFTWNMRKDGVRYPSWRTPKADADRPSGMGVLPGTYKVRYTWGDFMDSASVTVKQDPRLEVSEADLVAKARGYQEYYD